jgi:TolB-like protein/DNA-binding winged helix-turn-helix (wHTH) protein/Tfp pilus assembly protein PilF
MLDSLHLTSSMSAQHTSPKLIQFGVFELDLLRGELRKKGVKVKLQDQPFKVLRLLLENRGEVVSRDHLREHIWPANTFVEFDQGLYSAIARLRDTLGDTSDSPRFIETVARRGYRFIAGVTAPNAAQNDAISAKDLPEASLPMRAAPMFRHSVASLVAGLLGGALLLALVLTFNLADAREWLRGRSAIHAIAVLPLENLSGDPEQEYFADGMTDELITNLARLGNLRVVSRTSVMRYKKVSKPLADVGQELNVDAVVEGTVERSAGRVRIRVQLVQAATDSHLWAQTYDRELQDALLLQSDAARDIVREIQTSLAKPQLLPAPRQVNPAAYEAYLKGLYFSNKQSPESFRRSIDYFQQAISLDPGYAAAYSGLADMLLREIYEGTPPKEVLERAATTARKSVALDPFSPEGHNSLGTVYEFNWDWSAAEKEYQRAIQLNQNFAWGHQNYAIFLSLQGRNEQSLAEAQRSQELDPLSPFIYTTYGWDLENARRYEEALAKCQQALELDPYYLQAHRILMAIYVNLHRENEAFGERLKASTLFGETPAELAALKHAFQRDGMKGVWRMDLERISKSADPDPYRLAALSSRLGKTDQAMTWLERAYQSHHPLLEEIKQSGEFDNLRSDPRFADMLRRMNLQP